MMAGSVVKARPGEGLSGSEELSNASEAPGSDGVIIFCRLNSWGDSELSLSQGGPWFPVKAGDKFAEYRVMSVPAKGSDQGWIALEKENLHSGEIVYVEPLGVAGRIQKPFGKVGQQVAPAIEAHSREYWTTLLNAQNDILGKKYLADPRDPSLERTRQAYPPLTCPESYVGMKEYPHEVQISWDGSIGVDEGLITGKEPNTGEQDGVQLAAALPFALNGKEIELSESPKLLRGQLDYYLPIIQYVYQRETEQVGWEQIVLMGKVRGKPGLFLRFRLTNYSPKTKQLSFAVHPPADGELEPESDSTSITIVAPRAFLENGSPQNAKPVSTVLVSNKPFENERGLPVWNFQIQAGEHQDLYFALPGYCPPEPLALRPEQIRDAFFEALLGEYRTWQRFLKRGTQFQIPEPMVNEISQGALVKCLVCVDGDEVRGGAVWYEGFWPFCTIYLSQVLLELGYYEETRRFIQYFIDTRIEPSGVFNMGRPGDTTFQVFDTGDFLKLLANYFWYTRDPDLIAHNFEKINRVIKFIERSREKSLKEFPPADPRYGMIPGILNNDFSHQGPGYFYTNDAPIWEGLRDYAEVLQEIGTMLNQSEYNAEGQRLDLYAKQYYATLRRSFETAIEHEDGKISFIHIHPILDHPKRPVMCTFRTDTRNRGYRRFHDWPRLVGTDFLTDEERRFIFEYEFKHEQTVLGVRRFLPTSLDNFQCYNSSYQKLRLGMVREYLMEHYGNIQALVGPGLWSGFEQAQVVPADGERGRETGYLKYLKGPRIFGYEGAHMTWPIVRLTRQIFAFDQPKGRAVWVGRGIPHHWLTSGQMVSATSLPTRYGKLNMRYAYQREARTLKVEINPIEKRMIPELRVGARDPEGGRIRSVHCKPFNTKCKINARQDLVIIRSVDRPVSLRINFRGIR